jgi:hypothetical protein
MRIICDAKKAKKFALYLRGWDGQLQHHLRLFINEDRRVPRTGTGHVSSTALNALNVLLLLLPTSPAKSHLKEGRELKICLSLWFGIAEATAPADPSRLGFARNR